MTINKKAFTLIELLVVVLIIGILSAIALPQYTVAVEKARVAEAQMMISSLERGVDLYLMANGPVASMTFFLGKNKSVDLDIDATSALSCSSSENFCSSKNFEYEAYCDASSCILVATRHIGEDNVPFYLQDTKTGSNQWTRVCHSKNDLGSKICQQLKQNWTPEDNS